MQKSKKIQISKILKKYLEYEKNTKDFIKWKKCKEWKNYNTGADDTNLLHAVYTARYETAWDAAYDAEDKPNDPASGAQLRGGPGGDVLGAVGTGDGHSVGAVWGTCYILNLGNHSWLGMRLVGSLGWLIGSWGWLVGSSCWLVGSWSSHRWCSWYWLRVHIYRSSYLSWHSSIIARRVGWGL